MTEGTSAGPGKILEEISKFQLQVSRLLQTEAT